MTDLKDSLQNSFNLSIKREPTEQNYLMHTQFIQMGFDGIRKSTEDYWLNLKHIPKENTLANFDQCICNEFKISLDNETPKSIPILKNFKYQFDPLSSIGNNEVFGIPHEPFEKIKDDKENEIETDIKYAIYNNFVDYHALANILTMFGIEKITKIGDKITHAGAFSKAPINLKGIINIGSVFCNGEITLEFLGLSIVNNNVCAILKYDSGESTLDMDIIEKIGNTKTIGGSRYIGNIYLDLETGWTRKVELNEFVATKRKEFNKETKKNYTIRNLQINLK